LKFRCTKCEFIKSRKRKKPNITNLVSIHASHKEINERREVGYWEGDLIIFSTIESKKITTMVCCEFVNHKKARNRSRLYF
jgi:IS30 family transposase